MHEYNDSDGSTPKSLLEETVRYAQVILGDLKKAEITVGNKCHSEICSIGIACIPPKSPQYVVDEVSSNSKDLIVRRNSYEASHPAVVDGFFLLVEKLLENAGFNYVQGRSFDEYQENDCSRGATRGIVSIDSVSISCLAPPEKLRSVFTVSEGTLQQICLESLQERFDEMRKFRDTLQKSGLDTSRVIDPFVFAQELKDRGLPAPTVVRLPGSGKKPRKGPGNPH